MSFSGTKGYITKPKPGVMLNPLHPLSRGLVGYWLFNEGAGSLANDISGYGNHGTLINMSPNAQGSGWGGSKFGGGLQFDGSNDHVNVGSNVSLDSPTMTVIFQMYSLTYPTYKRIVAGPDSFSNKWVVASGEFSNNIAMQYGSNVGDGIQTNADTITLRQKQNIACVFDSANSKIYINGIVQSINASVPGLGISGTEVWIGGRQNDSGYLNSSINFAYLYNRALAAQEIKQLDHDPFCNLLQVPIRRYSLVAPPVGAIMNQFQRANIGADLYNGVFA